MNSENYSKHLQAKLWWVLDLAGIELRMLGHYLGRWSESFADTLLNGDIHQQNADRVGVSRRQIKTITYAFIYGAGDAKIGHSFDSALDDRDAKLQGKEIRAAFVSAIDGLAELLEAIKKASEKGFVRSIDGRKIALDSSHKALNYLLQSGAGTIAKRGCLSTNKLLNLQSCAVHSLHLYMTNCNSSATPPTQQTYQHPWYTAQQRLESTTTYESPSLLKQSKGRTGRRSIDETSS